MESVRFKYDSPLPGSFEPGAGHPVRLLPKGKEADFLGLHQG